MRVLKWIGISFLVLLALLVVAVLVIYTRVEPVFVVPRTVHDDPGLPMLSGDGVVLHGESFGDPAKPVVIVLHGGPGDDYRSLLSLEKLADSYRVVFFDQRGSGLSERVGPEKLKLEALYRDLDTVVSESAGTRRVHLVGHSFGAMLAAGWAGRHPERVAGLVLAEPGMLTDQAGAAFLEKTHGMKPGLSPKNLLIMGTAFFESLHVRGPDPEARRDYLSLRVLSNTQLEDHPLAAYWCDDRFPGSAFQHWRFGALASETLLAEGTDRAGRFRVHFSEGIGKLEQEVLIMVGACDRIIGLEHQRKYHLPLFKKLKMVEIEGAGHTMFGEKPTESVAAVRAYLDSLPP